MSEKHKRTVERLVDEVMNGADLAVLDEICTPRLARGLAKAFTEFRAAFPDWSQEILQLVAEDDTVVARLKCSGTQAGVWAGQEPTGRSMRIDEVYFYRFEGDRLDRMWGIEDTWTRLGQLFGAERAGDLAALGAPDLAFTDEP